MFTLYLPDECVLTKHSLIQIRYWYSRDGIEFGAFLVCDTFDNAYEYSYPLSKTTYHNQAQALEVIEALYAYKWAK
jgi:hypothetical protein